MGSIDIPLFRSTQIYSIAEVHLTDVPDDGNQHALRVTMGPILSQNFFTSIKIEQPAGSTVYLKLTSGVTDFMTGNFGTIIDILTQFPIIITTWEWSISPSFILDGTTDLKVTFGYDT